MWPDKGLLRTVLTSRWDKNNLHQSWQKSSQEWPTSRRWRTTLELREVLRHPSTRASISSLLEPPLPAPSPLSPFASSPRSDERWAPFCINENIGWKWKILNRSQQVYFVNVDCSTNNDDHHVGGYLDNDHDEPGQHENIDPVWVGGKCQCHVICTIGQNYNPSLRLPPKHWQQTEAHWWSLRSVNFLWKTRFWRLIGGWWPIEGENKVEICSALRLSRVTNLSLKLDEHNNNRTLPVETFFNQIQLQEDSQQIWPCPKSTCFSCQ